MSTIQLSDRLRAELQEFAWSQWAQLGLSGHISRQDKWAMDPEALILFTIEIARDDPRLFDELLDWLTRNHRLISVQRLHNLEKKFQADTDLVRAITTWVATASPSVRWPKSLPLRPSGQPQELFSPETIAFVATPDPVFSSFGYSRPMAALSGKSSEPLTVDPISFAFRLRLLFTPGTRSEIMRVLLTCEEPSLDAARIAEEAGFAKRNVNEALSALSQTGAVKARWSKNARVFEVFRGKWANVLEIGPGGKSLPTFVSWSRLLPALLDIARGLKGEELSDPSEYMLASKARTLLEPMRADLAMLDVQLPDPRAATGSAYWSVLEQVVESLLARTRRQP